LKPPQSHKDAKYDALLVDVALIAILFALAKKANSLHSPLPRFLNIVAVGTTCPLRGSPIKHLS